MQDSKFHTRESVEKDLKTYASYGVTTVLSMGTDQDTIFPVRNEQRAAARSLKLGGRRPSATMARVYTAGQGLMFKGGYGGLAGVNTPVATPEEAEAAVNAQLDKGVDVIKLWLDRELGTMPKMPPEITTGDHRRGAQARARACSRTSSTSRTRSGSPTRASTASCTACAISRSIRRSSTA